MLTSLSMQTLLLAAAFTSLIQSVPQTEVLKEGLGITIPSSTRSPVHIDPVEHQLVIGNWVQPSEGLQVGSARWTRVTANAEGWFTGPAVRGGYVYISYDSPSERTVFLEASGSTVSYINGEPRAGDPYMYGYLSLPVRLRKGPNHLLFLCGRGRMQAKLVEVSRPISFDTRDTTMPDLREGETGRYWAGVVIRNAKEGWLRDLEIEASSAGGRPVRSKVGPIGPLTVRKAAFQLDAKSATSIRLRLLLGGKVLDTASIELRRRKPHESYKRTFLAGLSDGVQYYAVQPATKPANGKGLVLSLHGASVEAIGQADAYAPKSWCDIVCPTNRRPFGFDWEEVGRKDALQVLDHAIATLGSDRSRVYLTGHSMGGHGTWQIGAHYPDRFAAIAPSAGWISFQTYAGGARFENPSPIEQLIVRSMAPSQTLLLKSNFFMQSVYVLHGDADDNVPVGQARQMRKELEGHPSLRWHEQTGAGHWWDASEEPGADCVDWAPIFDLFAKSRIPGLDEVRQVDFTTVNPWISGRCHWVRVLRQSSPLAVSRIKAESDPVLRRFRVKTENIEAFSLDLNALSGTGRVSFEIDGAKLGTEGSEEPVTFRRRGETWAIERRVTEPFPHGFKSVLCADPLFVVGTGGTSAERAWAYAKARFDAETYYYRGNGSAEVVLDSEVSEPRYRQRSLLLYGNSETNSVWRSEFPADCTVSSSKFALGSHFLSGDLAAFVLSPTSNSDRLVAAISGTSLSGMRLADRVPIWSSGVGIPDVLVLRPECLISGSKELAGAGFYGSLGTRNMDWAAGN